MSVRSTEKVFSTIEEDVNHIDSSNSIIKNISSDVYPYQYYNPTEGEWKDSCWVEINIEY